MKKTLQNIYLSLIIFLLYAPIVTLVVLSFNNSKTRAKWGGFTGKWNTFIQNYTHEYDVTIGFTDSSVEILKPSIYKAVNKVNKYYKKALKKEEVSREVATFNMGHILDCANVMCFDDNSKSFEEALKSANEPEEIIALFNQVTLRKL